MRYIIILSIIASIIATKASAGEVPAFLMGVQNAIHVDERLLAQVNTRINKVRYISDQKNYGKSDYWATPEEFYARGGDCEDYAIAKFFALKGYGVPEEDMTIITAIAVTGGEHHALLRVSLDGDDYILDNEENEPQGKEYLKKFTIKYTVTPAESVAGTKKYAGTGIKEFVGGKNW